MSVRKSRQAQKILIIIFVCETTHAALYSFHTKNPNLRLFRRPQCGERVKLLVIALTESKILADLDHVKFAIHFVIPLQ
jgi:hypothetical protein